MDNISENYIIDINKLYDFIFSNENIDNIIHEKMEDIDENHKVFGVQSKTIISKNNNIYNIRYDLFKQLLVLLSNTDNNLASQISLNTLINEKIIKKNE